MDLFKSQFKLVARYYLIGALRFYKISSKYNVLSICEKFGT